MHFVNVKKEDGQMFLLVYEALQYPILNKP